MSTLKETKFCNAPFPYFGGKREIANDVWQRLGRPKQYIDPFCGSAAMLLAAPARASLEVLNDVNFYVANFWRCIKFQPQNTYEWQDYPVSHVDLAARHRWLTEPKRTQVLCEALADAEWKGDAQIAGWWVWGQCCWIGSGWCESKIPHVGDAGRGVQSQIPHVGNVGRGVQSQIPHVGDAGRGVQSQIPHVSDAGMGVQSQIPHVSDAGMGVQSQIPHVSDAGRGVHDWFLFLADRLERVRVMHGDWSRCLNHHYGDTNTAIFFDPPYKSYEKLYHRNGEPVAAQVEQWCRKETGIKIVLCGLAGDYDLPGWVVMQWSRGRLTYSGGKTTNKECIWFSPECEDAMQKELI